MRASKYNIIIEFEAKKNILVHGYTGAIDLVSNSVASALENNNINDLGPETIMNLFKRGYITDLTPEEELSKIISAVTKLAQISGQPRQNFIFLVTYDCNLKCPYCFEHRADKINGKTLSKSQVSKIFGAIDQLTINNDQNHILTLFGGEPLLLANKAIIELILEEALQRNFQVEAVSNGLNLLEFMDLFGPDHISSVQITIDGPEKVQNQRKPYPGGSFSRVVEGIDCLLQNGTEVCLRMNLDEDNFSSLKEMCDFVKKKNWLEKKNFSFFPSPIIFLGGRPAVSRLKMLAEIKEYEKIVNHPGLTSGASLKCKLRLS